MHQRLAAALRSLRPSILILALLATTPSLLCAHGVTRFDNGRWWRGGAFRAGTMYSVDGRLALESDRAPDAVVDLEGRYVIPPLGDAHSHALADPDFDAQSDRLLAQGVFYVQNPNSLATWTGSARPKAERPETVDVTYALGGITSPGGHPAPIYDRFAQHSPEFEPEDMDGEAYHAVATLAELDHLWPTILAAGPDFVKIYLEHSEEHARRAADESFYGRRGLDPNLVPEVVQRAHDAALRVAAHVATAADFRTAVAGGVDEIAHLPLERLTREDARAAAAAGVVVVTTVLSHRPVDDPASLPEIHAHNLSLLSESGVALVLGTDSDRGLLAELLEVARLTGWSPHRLLDLATVATPRWIFPARAIGTLEPGQEASFVALDENPLDDLSRLGQLKLQVKGGHVLELAAAESLPGIANALAHTLVREGAPAAIAEYRRLREQSPAAYDFSEPQLNALGYFALEQDLADAAVAVFRLNAELFPESANVWDSLGDGLVAAGDDSGAISAYRKALEIAPDSEHTRGKLREAETRTAADA